MGRKAKNSGTGLRHEPESHTWEIIRSLVSSETDASKLLEIYYWTREPGIVEVIRGYLDLPERSQRHLSDFLRKNRPQQIATAIDQQGRLLLSAGEAQSDEKNQRSSAT